MHTLFHEPHLLRARRLERISSIGEEYTQTVPEDPHPEAQFLWAGKAFFKESRWSIERRTSMAMIIDTA